MQELHICKNLFNAGIDKSTHKIKLQCVKELPNRTYQNWLQYKDETSYLPQVWG